MTGRRDIKEWEEGYKEQGKGDIDESRVGM